MMVSLAINRLIDQKGACCIVSLLCRMARRRQDIRGRAFLRLHGMGQARRRDQSRSGNLCGHREVPALPTDIAFRISSKVVELDHLGRSLAEFIELDYFG
jgi:hypothetical protein